MPQYNDMFELSVSDIDLIETALSPDPGRSVARGGRAAGQRREGGTAQAGAGPGSAACTTRKSSTARRDGVYIGG